MKIVVIGGSGLIGKKLVPILRERGHEALPASPSSGVNALTGEGLAGALAGTDVVVDVANSPSFADAAVLEFFETSTRNLLAAERAAGVRHHVALSVVGADRLPDSGYMRAKVAQERLIEGGKVPYTIVRATQFHDFASMVVSWTVTDGVAIVPPLLVQPVAVGDVAHVLADVAVAPARSATIDLAGPQPQDLVDMARRTLARRGEEITLIPSWRDGPFGVEMAGEVLLPGPDAWLAPTTFETWLDEHADVAAATAR